MKHAWIDAQRKAYPLPVMDETLMLCVSGHRAWKRGGGRCHVAHDEKFSNRLTLTLRTNLPCSPLRPMFEHYPGQK